MDLEEFKKVEKEFRNYMIKSFLFDAFLLTMSILTIIGIVTVIILLIWGKTS